METSEEKNYVEKTGENTYRITNAEESVSSLKKGDTFSTKNEDGNVYLIKIAEISADGSTVTIQEDTNTDLTDYFDYVKIESEGFYGGYDDLSDGVSGYGARNTRATLRGLSVKQSHLMRQILEMDLKQQSRRKRFQIRKLLSQKRRSLRKFRCRMLYTHRKQPEPKALP